MRVDIDIWGFIIREHKCFIVLDCPDLAGTEIDVLLGTELFRRLPPMFIDFQIGLIQVNKSEPKKSTRTVRDKRQKPMDLKTQRVLFEKNLFFRKQLFCLHRALISITKTVRYNFKYFQKP